MFISALWNSFSSWVHIIIGGVAVQLYRKTEWRRASPQYPVLKHAYFLITRTLSIKVWFMRFATPFNYRQYVVVLEWPVPISIKHCLIDTFSSSSFVWKRLSLSLLCLCKQLTKFLQYWPTSVLFLNNWAWSDQWDVTVNAAKYNFPPRMGCLNGLQITERTVNWLFTVSNLPVHVYLGSFP